MLGISCKNKHYILTIPIWFFFLSCGKSTIQNNTVDTSLSAYEICTLDSITKGPCIVNIPGTFVSTRLQENMTNWNNPATTSIIVPLQTGYYENKVCSISDSTFTSSNILSGKTIFGITGGLTSSFSGSISSQAHRNPSSIPVSNNGDIQSTSLSMTIAQETMTYAGQSLPKTGGYNYREIPDQTIDDDGTLGTSCVYATRPSVNCGTTQSTIAERISDCSNLNGTCSDFSYTSKSTCEAASKTWTSSASWNGDTQCNNGGGVWKLVTRTASNKEVWQDQRSGLLWSSLVSTGHNWCQAAGNAELSPISYYQSCNTTTAGDDNCATSTSIVGNGTISNVTGGSSTETHRIRIIFSSSTAFTVVSSTGTGCTGGGVQNIGATSGSTKTYSVANHCSFTITQGTIPFSNNDKFFLDSIWESFFSCSGNAVSLCSEFTGLGPDNGETWTAGGYMSAKGEMGKNSSPAVNWKLPTIADYRLAELNGIRFVLPDMGIPGNQRPNPDSSIGGDTEWSSSTYNSDRAYSWTFTSGAGYIATDLMYHDRPVRCLGN